jgi:hypothetical protein
MEVQKKKFRPPCCFKILPVIEVSPICKNEIYRDIKIMDV